MAPWRWSGFPYQHGAMNLDRWKRPLCLQSRHDREEWKASNLNRIAARDFLTRRLAALPEDGIRLADAASKVLPDITIIDFSEVGAMSSSFAGAFYLRLVENHSVEVLERNLKLEGLSPFQAEVLSLTFDSVKLRLASSR